MSCELIVQNTPGPFNPGPPPASLPIQQRGAWYLRRIHELAAAAHAKAKALAEARYQACTAHQATANHTAGLHRTTPAIAEQHATRAAHAVVAVQPHPALATTIPVRWHSPPIFLGVALFVVSFLLAVRFIRRGWPNLPLVLQLIFSVLASTVVESIIAIMLSPLIAIGDFAGPGAAVALILGFTVAGGGATLGALIYARGGSGSRLINWLIETTGAAFVMVPVIWLVGLAHPSRGTKVALMISWAFGLLWHRPGKRLWAKMLSLSRS